LLWFAFFVLFLTFRAGFSGRGRCCFDFRLFGWLWEGGEKGAVWWGWRSNEGFEVGKVGFYAVQRSSEGGMMGSVGEI
jgi:hypothetical protein